jgi:phage virion morphogenesis protein
MSDFNIIIDDKELQYQFKKLIDRGTNTRPLMQRLAQRLHFIVDENFEKEGRPRRWRPLNPATIRQRKRKGYTGNILQRTGQLKRSITEKVTNTEAIVGTNLKYAGVHQFGSRKQNIPARPFLKVTKDDIGILTNMVKQYILDTRG